MKMPAQYACVAAPEMEYLTGGAYLRINLEDFSWEQLGESWFRSVGNQFLSKALNSMFDFDWVLPSFNFSSGSSSSGTVSEEEAKAQEQVRQFLARAGQFMVQTFGFVAALYVLGTGTARLAG